MIRTLKTHQYKTTKSSRLKSVLALFHHLGIEKKTTVKDDTVDPVWDNEVV